MDDAQARRRLLRPPRASERCRDPAHAEAEIAWAHAFMATMRPWGVGKAPANFITADEGQTRLRASFGDEKHDRLAALKTIYDPANVFALNHNIAPSAPRARR